MRTSSVGDSFNGGSHTRCAGVPCPASRFSTASIRGRVGTPVSSGDRSGRSVSRPAAAAVNTRGVPSAFGRCTILGLSCGADTKAVWNRTNSPDAVFKYAAPGELGKWYASGTPSTARDSLAEKVFRHMR